MIGATYLSSHRVIEIQYAYLTCQLAASPAVLFHFLFFPLDRKSNAGNKLLFDRLPGRRLRPSKPKLVHSYDDLLTLLLDTGD